MGLAVAGGLAGLLMIATELSTIASVDVANGSCSVINDSSPELADRCVLSGFERHGGAFAVLGLLCLAMAYGAGPRRSRPAAVSLLVTGAIVLALTLLVDLPVTDETGAIGRNFEGAEGRRGTGLYVELVAGLMAMGAGAVRLLRPRDV